MLSPHRAQLQEISQAAFGQRYRLEVMLAIADAEDGFVSLSELAQQLGVSVSTLQGPFRDLVAVGLLSPLPHGDSRHRFYHRNPSSAWSWAQELHAQTQLVDELRRQKDTSPARDTAWH